MRRKLIAAMAAAAALSTLGVSASPAAAAITQTTSNNWAGYVVTGNTFSSVSGSWIVPTAKSDSSGYSAFWVGLGGASDGSHSIEQVGTDSDYVDGQPSYYAWYELLPQPSVKTKLPVHPGDQISARASVSGSSVTFRLSDSTTGKSLTKHLRMKNPDTSSAEWIAEAPSGSSATGDQILPLADFGSATFSQATATANGHTGTITDSQWTAEQVQLTGSSTASQPGGIPPGLGDAVSGPPAAASTSPPSPDGSSFTVTWSAASSGVQLGTEVSSVSHGRAGIVSG